MSTQQKWLREQPGPASVAQVIDEFEAMARTGQRSQFRPLATGFIPLDEILNGGLRPGELMVIGGPYGVGKTILALQMARNAVLSDPHAKAIYICYEHDRTHLLSRLICLESAERDTNGGSDSLTLRKLGKLTYSPIEASGLISLLRRDRRYVDMLRTIDSYADRLILARAGGTHTLQDIQRWVEDLQTPGTSQILVAVDYLQKIAFKHDRYMDEDELTTQLSHGLKELALAQGVPVVAIAAADRPSLKGQRMRFADLRGSSALQYEADVGLVLNNKYDIVSREHLIYNLSDAEAMRNWLVMTVEKNRAGRNTVDMEYALDGAHFRLMPEGAFVRERLIDGKAVLE